MYKTLILTGLGFIVAGAAVLLAQQAPQIQNGKVETRRAAAIDREIAAASPTASSEPAWVAWRTPMVPGDRDMCSWYSDRFTTMRGMYMDEGSVFVTSSGVSEPQRQPIAPPKGPVALEGGTSLVVLARVVGGRVERLRTVGDDCPMDAGGRTVVWLEGVTPAESVRFLASLGDVGPADRTMYENDRTVATSAVRAIGYHQDAAADAALDRIATGHRDSSVRRQAASTLTSLRGAHGVATVTRLLSTTTDQEDRRSLTSALGQSRDASVVSTLRSLLNDPDTNVRSDAVFYFIQRGGVAVVPEALKAVSSDKTESVRRRAVSAIGRLPADAGVPQLLDIARATTTDGVMRKEAVTQLSQSKDKRALAYMEEILKR